MDRIKKIELIQRSLGIRHKLKVHETMKAPDSHEDLAVMLQSKWDLEDELHAIEELLSEDRQRNVAHKRAEYEKAIKLAEKESAVDDKDSAKKKTKK